MQVKTNEYNVPWDPKDEDQKVDSRNYNSGVDQLDRDILRFLEMLPDLVMTNLKIVTNVAFPLAPEPDARALTKEDFEIRNARSLLEKLGISLAQTVCKPSAEMEATYKRIACRYLGAHAKMSATTSLDAGLEALGLAVKGIESGFKAEMTNLNMLDEEKIENTRRAVSQDAWMRRIRRAKEHQKFGEKFQKENINIPLDDLRIDSKRFLIQISIKSYPLFGSDVIDAVLKAVDDNVTHQGAKAVMDKLAKDKYVFYNQAGDLLNLETTVKEYTRSCVDCYRVQAIRSKIALGNADATTEGSNFAEEGDQGTNLQRGGYYA